MRDRTDQPVTIRRNVPLYYIVVLLFFLGQSLPLSIIIFYLITTKGLRLSDIAFLQIVYELTFLLFVLLAGSISDLVNRRMTVMLGLLTAALSFLLYGYGVMLTQFMLAECVSAIANSLVATSLTPLAVDTLVSLQLKSEITRVLSVGNALNTFGSVAGGVSAAALAGLFGMSAPFALGIPIVLLGLPVSYMIRSISQSQQSENQRHHGTRLYRHLRSSFNYARSNRDALRLIFSAVSDNYSVIAISILWQPIVIGMGANIGFIGILASLLGLASAFGSYSIRRLSNIIQQKTVVIISIVFSVPALLLAALTSDIRWFSISLIIWQALLGMRTVSSVSWFNLVIPSGIRGTVSAVRQIGARFGSIVSNLIIIIVSSTIGGSRPMLLITVMILIVSLAIYFSTNSPKREQIR